MWNADSGILHFPNLIALSREELAFAETFLRVQGSIREMEKELGISYPTVKKKFRDDHSQNGL